MTWHWPWEIQSLAYAGAVLSDNKCTYLIDREMPGLILANTMD